MSEEVKRLLASAEMWVDLAAEYEELGEPGKAESCLAVSAERYDEAARRVESGGAEKPECWKEGAK